MSRHTTITETREPVWASATSRGAQQPPAAISPWLLDPGSLTRAVVRACSGSFRVRVLHQGWGRALPSEARRLRVRRTAACMVREVELLCDEVPWVFARTLVPATSLSGGARRLAQLGSKPLGAVLFADPTTKRAAMELARLTPRDPLFAAAADHLEKRPAELWGRRTLFWYAGKPLLVNEIFLPPIPPR